MDLPVAALEPVAEEDKAALANLVLVQLYRYDFSEVRAYELTEHGTFVYRFLDHYWCEPGRHAFFIRVGGRFAGFASARDAGGEHEHEVEEFFVVRRHRRAGVGRTAALDLFARLPGRWPLVHDDANEAASRFWERVVIHASVGVFEREEVTTSAGIVGHRYRFRPLSDMAVVLPIPSEQGTPSRTRGEDAHPGT
jgi:predicted acetyltransferase